MVTDYERAIRDLMDIEQELIDESNAEFAKFDPDNPNTLEHWDNARELSDKAQITREIRLELTARETMRTGGFV